MIIKYSDNPFRQILGISFYNRMDILAFVVINVIATVQYYYLPEWGLLGLTLPAVPVTILGSALAIFLGFRNNSAYDRWWEARKIWGGIVNASRTFSSFVLTFVCERWGAAETSDEIKAVHRRIIHRHIAWLYALKMHLRNHNFWDQLERYLPPEEIDEIRSLHNKPAQILHRQSVNIQDVYERGLTDDFRHMEIASVIRELYELQGKAERIKGTIFPYYYNYFTNVFLWLFILCLPFALVEAMGWANILMGVAISFVFKILEKSGSITEDPFEGRAVDTPISTITRNIEIDLLEMLESDTVPAPTEPVIGRFGVKYMN